MSERTDKGGAMIGAVALAGLGTALLWLRWSSREPNLIERTRARLR